MKLITLIFFFLSVSYAQITGDVKFYFLGRSATDYRMLTASSQFLSVKYTTYYNPSKRTVIYFHGWNSNFKGEGVQTIAKAYLRRGDHNIIMADWSKFAGGNYVRVVGNMPRVKKF